MAHYDYIIVGAGPAGLQMGYFLHKKGRSYLIVEAAAEAGHFYRTYPRHRTLLSLNKRHNWFEEEDFNLRHDWNSLLSDVPALRFEKYSSELYPSADDLYRYLRDFAAHWPLSIRYEWPVARIDREGDGKPFLLTGPSGEVLSANVLCMATGATGERVPEDIEGLEHAMQYSDHPLDPERYANRRVAIIGRGNSAFEVANHLAGTAAFIHLFVGRPIKHAWQTHFVGDLRAINNTVLDMYQLKSLHAALGFMAEKIEPQPDGSLRVSVREELPHWSQPSVSRTTLTYDDVIVCTGWRYTSPELFTERCTPAIDEKKKYPVLSAMWESSVPDLYYIGAAMAGADRKSASGFIHGFRYNVRSLHHMLEHRYEKQPLPSESFGAGALDELTRALLKRYSTVSALYQMNGVLCDVIELAEEKNEIYFELPKPAVTPNGDFLTPSRCIVATLEYGFDRYPGGHVALDFIHPSDAFDPSCSAFLHPVFRLYEGGELKDELHLGESLVVRYDRHDYEENAADMHFNALSKFLHRARGVEVPARSELPFAPEVRERILSPLSPERLEALRELDRQPRCSMSAKPMSAAAAGTGGE